MTNAQPGFGEAQRVYDQRPLRIPKGQPTHGQWIVIACGDANFNLTKIMIDGDKITPSGAPTPGERYRSLWDELARLDLGGQKAWLIGWRVRYALDRADFIGSLERGEISLPRARAGKRKGRPGAKLTLTNRIVEVDVVCGKNQIKILDLQNYGVEPAPYCTHGADVQMYEVHDAFIDLMNMSRATNTPIAKSTSAQVGWAKARQLLTPGILWTNRDSQARALERLAYFGGRCEAFRLGDISGVVHSLDVKSCYAMICRDEMLPCQLIEEYRCGLPVESIDPEVDDHWIADVEIRTGLPDYPVRFGGSTIYPIGHFRTALPWPELRRALRAQCVVRVIRAARYRAAPVLSSYAHWYLNSRGSAGTFYPAPAAGALKSAFNASLGYTARENYDWQPWQCQIGYRWWIGLTMHPETKSSAVQAQILDGERRWLRVAGEPYESMPYLHATICSYARVRLLDIFYTAGPGNVLYCDTDGVLVTQVGESRLRNKRRPDDGWTHGLVRRFPPGRACILGQKTYSVGDNVIQAGVPKTSYERALKKRTPITETGRVDSDGIVHPFEFVVVDGQNVMV
jgi:hypothetical protein